MIPFLSHECMVVPLSLDLPMERQSHVVKRFTVAYTTLTRFRIDTQSRHKQMACTLNGPSNWCKGAGLDSPYSNAFKLLQLMSSLQTASASLGFQAAPLSECPSEDSCSSSCFARACSSCSFCLRTACARSYAALRSRLTCNGAEQSQVSTPRETARRLLKWLRLLMTHCC